MCFNVLLFHLTFSRIVLDGNVNTLDHCLNSRYGDISRVTVNDIYVIKGKINIENVKYT